MARSIPDDFAGLIYRTAEPRRRTLGYIPSTARASRLHAVPEIGRPTDGPSSAGHSTGVRPAKREISQDTELYEIVYREAQRALDDQQVELRGTRDRSVQFTAFAGAATAFLVGAGLHPSHRDASFYALASVASALSITLILLLLALLFPRRHKLWHYRLSARSLITGWIEAQTPPPSHAYVIRALARKCDDMREENEKLLISLRMWYRWLVVVGAAQVAAWVALVWVKG
jgi:hypothetical protein